MAAPSQPSQMLPPKAASTRGSFTSGAGRLVLHPVVEDCSGRRGRGQIGVSAGRSLCPGHVTHDHSSSLGYSLLCSACSRRSCLISSFELELVPLSPAFLACCSNS